MENLFVEAQWTPLPPPHRRADCSAVVVIGDHLSGVGREKPTPVCRPTSSSASQKAGRCSCMLPLNRLRKVMKPLRWATRLRTITKTK